MSSTALTVFSRAMVGISARESYASATDAKVSAMTARKKHIEMLLAGAAMPVLVHAESIRDWIEITDALAPVCAQPEQKPKGGRPRSGVAEAARKLPFPSYMTDSAKRQLVQRALRISRIYPRAKNEARVHQLDDNQAALLAIAAEETEEAQIEVAKTWRRRNRQGQRVSGDADAYTVTGLGHLDIAARQSLDQVISALPAKFGVVVKHIQSTSTSASGAAAPVPEETA